MMLFILVLACFPKQKYILAQFYYAISIGCFFYVLLCGDRIDIFDVVVGSTQTTPSLAPNAPYPGEGGPPYMYV
jgi:hypothetical protein